MGNTELQVTARGKYGDKRDTRGLTSAFLNNIPDISNNEAETLAQLTQASISYNTAKNYSSIERTIQKHFPDRPQIFKNNLPRDQLLIVARLINNRYKPKTIKGYLAAYDRIVLNNVSPAS